MKNLIVIMILLLSSPAWGATYYVCQSAAGVGDGSSAGNCSAIATFNAGTAPYDDLADDTVYLLDVITTGVTIPVSGTSGHVVTIRGDYAGHAAALTTASGYAVTAASKSYVTLIGITATAAASSGAYINGGDVWIIQNCTFTGSANGLYANAVPTVTVQDSTLTNTGTGTNYYGGRFDGTGATTLVLDGVTVTSTVYGIMTATYTSQTFDNISITLSGTSRHGIWFKLANSMTIDVDGVDITIGAGQDSGYDGIYLEGNGATGLTVTLNDITVSGANHNGITAGETATYTGFTLTNSNLSSNGANGVYLDYVENITLTNVTANSNHATGIYLLNGSTATATGCTMNSNGIDGLDVDYFTNYTFTQCSANSNGTRDETAAGDGFSAHNSCTGGVFKYCVASLNKNSGFAFVNDSAGTVYNCTAYGNGDKSTINLGIRGGFYNVSTGAWTLKNNLFSANYPYELLFAAASYSAATLDYNHYYHVGNGITAEAEAFTVDSGKNKLSWATYHGSYESHSAYGDPKLTSSTVYTLQPSSPAINAGTLVTGLHDQATAATDYAGRKVLQFMRPSIGAFESYKNVYEPGVFRPAMNNRPLGIVP